MLVYEDRLKVGAPQHAASEAAIRSTQVRRNSCLRLWREGRGSGATAR